MFRSEFLTYIHRYLDMKHLPPSLAEDWLQDTYEKVCKSFEYWDPEQTTGGIGALMRTIVIHTCRGNCRKEAQRWREVPESVAYYDEDDGESTRDRSDTVALSAFMTENAPGRMEAPLPLVKPVRKQRSDKKPKVVRVRGPRLPAEERERRAAVRLEWAAEIRSVG